MAVRIPWLLLLLWASGVSAQDTPDTPAPEQPNPEQPPPEQPTPDEPPPELPPPEDSAPEPEAPPESEVPPGSTPVRPPEPPPDADPDAPGEQGPQTGPEPGPASPEISAEPQRQLISDADTTADTDAEDGWGDEDDDAGFEALPDEGPFQPDAEPEISAGELSVGGFLRSSGALWAERLDDNPYAKARQSADLTLRYKRSFGSSADPVLARVVGDVHLEYDLAYRHRRDSHDDATLDVYESQIIGGETFVALSYQSLELTFGRQIVAWGEGAMLSPLDVVNPRDNREPGLGELDDVRMAVLASRVGLFFGQHRLETMIVHEAFFGLSPAPLSDYSPLRSLILEDDSAAALLSGKNLRQRHVPGRWVNSAGQLLQRWTYAGEGIDLAVYAASVLDRQGVPALPSPAEFANRNVDLLTWHPRYTMLGHSGARPIENFILQWELGVDIRKPLVVTDPASDDFSLSFERRTQINAMLGISYSGVEDATLGFEVAQAVLPDNPERDDNLADIELLAPVEQPVFAARWMHNFLRETLQLTVVGTLFGLTEYRGWFGRAELTYALRDALKVGLGYATYHPYGEFGPLFGLDDHDRLFATLRWDFLLE